MWSDDVAAYAKAMHLYQTGGWEPKVGELVLVWGSTPATVIGRCGMGDHPFADYAVRKRRGLRRVVDVPLSALTPLDAVDALAELAKRERS
jgi:hypothetical protein